MTPQTIPVKSRKRMTPAKSPFRRVARVSLRNLGRKARVMKTKAMPKRRAMRLKGPMPLRPTFISR